MVLRATRGGASLNTASSGTSRDELAESSTSHPLASRRTSLPYRYRTPPPTETAKTFEEDIPAAAKEEEGLKDTVESMKATSSLASKGTPDASFSASFRRLTF